MGKDHGVRHLGPDHPRHACRVGSQGSPPGSGGSHRPTVAIALQYLDFALDVLLGGGPGSFPGRSTSKALQLLDGAEKGFVLHVEAGRIDHANHANDTGGFVWDWMAAADAFRVLLDYVDRNPGTLLISAVDHDTGGGVLYGLGSGYNDSTPAFERLGGARASLGRIRSCLERSPTAADVEGTVRELLSFRPATSQVEAARRVVREGERHGHPSAHSNGLHPLQFILSGVASGESDRPNVSFATGNHTGGRVPVFCYGAGVSGASLAVVDNTELFGWMTGSLGVEGFENPSMTEAEALESAALDVDRRGRPHWI